MITKILKPERFNSAELAVFTLDYLANRTTLISRKEAEHQIVMDAIQFALDRLKAEGVIG